jgi:hypothetical protein
MENNENNNKPKNNKPLLKEDIKNLNEEKPNPVYPIIEPPKEPEGISDKEIEEEMKNTTNPLNNRDKIDEEPNSSKKSKNKANSKDGKQNEANKTNNNLVNQNEADNAESVKEENSIIKLDFSKGRL